MQGEAIIHVSDLCKVFRVLKRKPGFLGGAYRFYGLLALVIGWVFLGLALAVWRVAIRRYQSTGS